MKGIAITLGVIVLAVGGFFGCAFMKRGEIISRDEQVTRTWGDIESTLQRRLDLIPNLVETVKGAGKYEGETLVKITESRNQILALAKSFGDALKSRDTEKMNSLEANLMSSVRAYTGLAAEAYPQLKAVEMYSKLMDELAGAENRINVARQDYNASVAALNTSVRTWGWMPLCGGVETRQEFKAAPEAHKAPAVNFNK